MFRTSALCLVLAILCFVSVGCGGAEKGKNKDADRPKTADTK